MANNDHRFCLVFVRTERDPATHKVSWEIYALQTFNSVREGDVTVDLIISNSQFNATSSKRLMSMFTSGRTTTKDPNEDRISMSRLQTATGLLVQTVPSDEKESFRSMTNCTRSCSVFSSVKILYYMFEMDSPAIHYTDQAANEVVALDLRLAVYNKSSIQSAPL